MSLHHLKGDAITGEQLDGGALEHPQLLGDWQQGRWAARNRGYEVKMKHRGWLLTGMNIARSQTTDGPEIQQKVF